MLRIASEADADEELTALVTGYTQLYNMTNRKYMITHVKEKIWKSD